MSKNINCNNCNNEIPKKAINCPYCGAENIHKKVKKTGRTLKIYSIIITVLAISWGMNLAGANEEVDKYKSAYENLGSKYASLSEQYDSLLDDYSTLKEASTLEYNSSEDDNVQDIEYTSYITKDEANNIISQDKIEVTANTIVALYKDNKNEVTLNTKYDKKHVVVSGQVKKITSSDKMIIYIDDDAGRSFIGIGCEFYNGVCSDVIGELNTGDYVEISGVGYAGAIAYNMLYCYDVKITESRTGSDTVNKDSNNQLANDQSKDEFIASCKKIEYNDILRNPDNYENTPCIVTGTVDQVIEGWFGYYSIYIKDSNGNKWDCTYSYSDGEARILENDTITIYGVCNGTSNSTTVLGAQVTMPDITVKYYK